MNPTRYLFFLVPALTLVGGCQSPPAPVASPPQILRVMTYNIHHGEGLDGKVDLARIAKIISAERADIVALQEVDRGVRRTAGRDLPAELAQLTGLTCIFSNNFAYQGGEYGNAVLTRFPVLRATNSLYQMLRPNEQRGLLQLTLDVHGRELVFLNTHIDYRPDDSERRLNVKEIQTLTAGYQGLPVILCGDFNTTPESRVHAELRTTFTDAWPLSGGGEGFTFPANAPDRRIDYVWVSPPNRLRPIRASVPASEASDHRPLVVEFQFQ
jgi:endonuclease/exonuclease/phosphatase family metal-dependent hydrolase